MMGKMILGEVSVKNISGPVTIADYAGQSAKIGWVAFIGYLALVSVSLGVLNLLPIPMLDGGHLLYYLIEIVRGSPPPERFMEWGQRIGLGLLSALMALALFNDSMRYLTQWLTP
jgi:regulator of sigma E protease